MALENIMPAWPTWDWDIPAWPRAFPATSSLQLKYGAYADEMVVRFDDDVHYDEFVVPLRTPDIEYAGLLVAGNSGTVVGVHVYPLAAFAVQRHPSWRAAAELNPSPEVAARIVADIKNLFDRYGVERVFDNPV